MIDDCAFGRIVIDGKVYTSDLIIYPDGHIEDNWWRASGHRLSSGDIQKLIHSKPDVIVAGKGVSGQMKPEKALENLLHKQGIKFIAQSNQKAMEIYNNLISKVNVGACFHLTC